MDEGDKDIVATARRECEEEIGPVNAEILGVWHDVPNKDRTVAVTPVIAWLGDVDLSSLSPNRMEVIGQRCMYTCAGPVHINIFSTHRCT